MPERPNVVVIMTDQHRAGLSARSGFALDTTPFLDTLASRGTWFDRAYTTTPVCAPARVSFLTGRWPRATGIDTNDPSHPEYDDDLFDVMGGRGYATALVGKNHSHLDPNDLNYRSQYTHRGGFGDDRSETERAMDDYIDGLDHGVADEPAPGPADATPPARAVDDATAWIDSLDDDPFCLWLSIPEPHNPFYAPEPYFSLFPPEELPSPTAGPDDLESKGAEWRFLREVEALAVDDLDATIPRMRANYFGMLRLIDDQVRRFVTFLDDAGLRDDTIVIYTSDHGDFVGEYGLIRKGPRTPNALSRIPLVIDGPGVISSDGPHPAHVSIADMFPTLCDAVGETLPEGVQGRSLWPLLTGDPYPEAEFRSVFVEGGFGGLPVAAADADPAEAVSDAIGFNELNAVMQSGRTAAVRCGEWMLHVDAHGDPELYNVADDPMERVDRYGEPGTEAVGRDLLEEVIRWQLRLTGPGAGVESDDIRRDDRNYWTPYRRD